MRFFATGALQSPPDPRDFRLAAAAIRELPKKHMQEMPPVIDQGKVGNCVAQACCYASKAANGPDFDPNWVYGRRKETDYQGPGWYLRLALKTLLKEGNVPWTGQEPLEVEDVQKYVKKHEARLLALARDYKIEHYARLASANEIKTALLAGMRVVFSAPITSFEPDQEGLFRCTINEHGGHAMSVWGYDGELFRVQNSWGRDWGQSGRCWMLAEDILRWNDCWAIADVPSKSIIQPEIQEMAVRYPARIRTRTKGSRVNLRKTSSAMSPKVGSVRDGSVVLVLAERGTRREICFGDGKIYLTGWIPASYINPAAGYREKDEEL
ncbi:MAG: C1 family peptidase [Christensenellales bacterium]|jgi:hypothetical protein